MLTGDGVRGGKRDQTIASVTVGEIGKTQREGWADNLYRG